MRNYLFRGKRKYNDTRWICGYLVVSPQNGEARIYDSEGTFNVVEKSSVGQDTGLKDKNGEKIFEGDILVCESSGGTKYFTDVRYDGGALSIDVIDLDYDITAIGWAMKDYLLSVEIIGNIHDNPELMEEQENDI